MAETKETIFYKYFVAQYAQDNKEYSLRTHTVRENNAASTKYFASFKTRRGDVEVEVTSAEYDILLAAIDD